MRSGGEADTVAEAEAEAEAGAEIGEETGERERFGVTSPSSGDESMIAEPGEAEGRESKGS